MSVGTMIVTCPGCGKSFGLEVELSGVEVFKYALVVKYRPSEIKHECKGRE